MAEFCAGRPEAASHQLALELAVEELFTNLVRHNAGGGDDVALDLEADGDLIRVRLTDREVEGFDPAAIDPLDPEAPLSQRRPGGMGVALVRGLFDDLTYEYRDRILTVTAVKRLKE